MLIQLYVVHLRTRPLRRGTRYEIDCAGPLIIQLPADSSGIQASATDASGSQVPLAVQASLTAIPLAFAKSLRAQPGTQFADIGQPGLSTGSYTVELAFSLPEARAFQEKVLYAALIACGHSKYLQPIRPLVTSMTRVLALAIQPTTTETSASAPHLFGGIRSYGEATRTVSCAR